MFSTNDIWRTRFTSNSVSAEMLTPGITGRFQLDSKVKMTDLLPWKKLCSKFYYYNIITITSEIIKSSYCITTNQNLKISTLVRILDFAIVWQ